MLRKRRIPMQRILMFSVIGFLAATAARADDGLSLIRDGKSDYVVVVPDGATPVEHTAARELQHYLTEVSGATLPIVAEPEVKEGTPRVLIGDCRATRSLLPSLDPLKLPFDAIVLKTVGRDLVLVGHPRRGTLYAVDTLLEDIVGVRWWTTTESTVPKRPTLTLSPLDISYAPKFFDRSTRYLDLAEGYPFRMNHPEITAQDRKAMGIFTARLKLNGHDHYAIPAEYGGANTLLGWVHTFSELEPLLPADKYFKDHPEWYSLHQGKRLGRDGQLCLANEEMRKELTRNVLERLRHAPGATMISVSQNDNWQPCECEKCRAVDRAEGSPSGLIIRTVNAVAEAVEKEFPGVLVETLAYYYSRKPPKLARPRHNVIVRFCTIRCSFSQPLETGQQNQPFREDFEGWRRISPQLYVWDYVTNFHAYLLPHPNFHVLAPNLRYFSTNNVRGVFEQGDSGSRVGDFVRLRAWLLAHLLWNPDADETKLLGDFMSGYYGAAAPYLTEYLHTMSEAVRRTPFFLSCISDDATEKWLTLDDLNHATRLFDKAAKAVDGQPTLAARVRRERMPLDLVWLQRYGEWKRQAMAAHSPFLGPEDRKAACEEVI
jgi:hypothetical protein